MKNSRIYTVLAIMAMILSIASCNDGRLKVKGNIEGGEGKCVVLERPDLSGNWIMLDSAKVSGNGSFSISFERPATEEVYRLVMDGRYIYFPVEGDETVRLTTTAVNFGIDYRLEGSPSAEKMAAFDIEANKLPAISDLDSVARFKRKVFTEIIHDSQGSLLSYYVLTKSLGSRLLFDPADATDAQYITAVATAFTQFKPEDSHTRFLEQLALASQRNRNKQRGAYATVEAEELEFPDIELPDYTGTNRRLSDNVGKGTPAVLVFNILTADDAINVTRALKAAKDKKGGNLTIYQIGYDTDVHAWTEVASGQPWVNVYDINDSNSQVLINYNVDRVPVFFIFDRAGHLVDRASTIAELDKKLAGI